MLCVKFKTFFFFDKLVITTSEPNTNAHKTLNATGVNALKIREKVTSNW